MKTSFKRKKFLLSSLLLLTYCGSSVSVNQRQNSLSQDLRCVWWNPLLEATLIGRPQAMCLAEEPGHMRDSGHEWEGEPGEGIEGDPETRPEESILKVEDERPKIADEVNQLDSNALNESTVGKTVESAGENSSASILNSSIIPEKKVMPSFDEWKKIHADGTLQEPQAVAPEEVKRASKPRKVERKNGKNYASLECGAKVVAANAGAEGATNILHESKDQYMLNPCNVLQKGGLWFTIDLCETIHPTHLELANFELFSSTVKKFVVSMGQFNSENLTPIGEFEMDQVKTVQTFPLDAPGFGKVIKVEFLSVHESSQYYCPLSLARVFGNTMVEEYQENESQIKYVPEDIAEPTKTENKSEEQEATASSIKEKVFSGAVKAMSSLVNLVVQGTSDGNCTNCSNDTKESPTFVGQGGCMGVSNLSGAAETVLWPSMKCRFAEVANVHLFEETSKLTTDPGKADSSSRKHSQKSESDREVESGTSSRISPTSTHRTIEISTTASLPPKKVDQKPESILLDPSPRKSDGSSLAGEEVKQSVVPQAPPPQTGGHVKASNGEQPTTKENLFSRFESRIKTLELHMNLSGTYLDELSKRYRDQMLEMQAAFNKTVAVLDRESKVGIERDHNQQIALAAIQEKLSATSESLSRLQSEHDALWWRLLLAYFALLSMTVAIFIVIFHLLMKRMILKYLSSDVIDHRVSAMLKEELVVALRRIEEEARSSQPSDESSKPIEEGVVKKEVGDVYSDEKPSISVDTKEMVTSEQLTAEVPKMSEIMEAGFSHPVKQETCPEPASPLCSQLSTLRDLS